MAKEDEVDSSDIFLKPHKDYVRRDNTISSATSRDLDFCFKVALKEAAKEDKLVKEVFYTALSAYTNNPINLAINAPSGEGKTHVLMKVSGLFPENDVQFIADMSDKAIFHKNGYLGIRNEDGDFENIEGELFDLKESLDSKILDFQKTGKGDLETDNELKKEIDEIQKQIKTIRDKAVKVIDLNHKILIFLDTPKKGIFEALMSLLSHDKLAVEYHYVDTSSKTGIVTKTNVLVGWPAVIFAQATDFTSHPRYHEIQRRFTVTNPRMDGEKYQSAVSLIIAKNCVPDFAYQLKVVSDEEKEKAREILLNIRDDLMSVSSTTKPGKNNTFIPYGHLIRNLLTKNNTAQDMTFVNRLLNLVVLLTSINIKKRPFLEIKPIFSSNSFRNPMALYPDLLEALSLINNSTGGIRPYVLEWYQNVFLSLYGHKSNPNSRVKNGEVVTEERIAVTTQELMEKTCEVMNKHYASKNLLTEFLYPLLNLGYIDSIRSLIDGRAYIYFPVLDIINEKSINLFLLGQKNKLVEHTKDTNVILTSDDDRLQIISNIDEVMKYYSENMYSVTLRIADADTPGSTDKEEYTKTEEIVDKYYSRFDFDNYDPGKNKVVNQNDRFTSPSSDEYSQIALDPCNLQDNQVSNIKNSNNSLESSNKLFSEEEKNKIIYSCYYCSSTINIQSEYERHVVLKHPERLVYPDMSYITKEGLTPQGKCWEKDDGNV
ncbi:hypothetical protein [Candidatus Nitrosocosmicus arcticus]|uniref:C2H2-type domain-containing protein n=1 Tax=Candidatus Nitrosocosmicus arcticus TaxID=2035267 RepID=A0A557SYW0_9ARCH|nr:hypothetical protein [Candidatus Nitrosocosmicus arcticus]TVP41786.1 hypothetical protein NARC_10192 [Candidatus Nitrosocosmicus arcticus]